MGYLVYLDTQKSLLNTSPQPTEVNHSHSNITQTLHLPHSSPPPLEPAPELAQESEKSAEPDTETKSTITSKPPNDPQAIEPYNHTLPPINTHKKESTKPRIAIIIDDIGYGQTLGQKFINMPYPLSYAFIPFSPYGKKLALHANQHNKLVMLHAPMATIGNHGKWEENIHPNMTDAEIENMLGNMLADIPHVQGVNNHGGSRFTQSSDKMRVVFNQLKKRDLFFIDSRTSAQTVGLATANAVGLHFAERDVFLDNSKKESDINVQIDTLIATAKKQGFAIGIAHPYMETYTVLQERLNTLVLDDIELVPVNLLLN